MFLLPPSGSHRLQVQVNKRTHLIFKHSKKIYQLGILEIPVTLKNSSALTHDVVYFTGNLLTTRLGKDLQVIWKVDYLISYIVKDQFSDWVSFIF